MSHGHGKTFGKGGTHPPENKFCDPTKYDVLPVPEMLVIPLAQHLGGPARPLVKNRDEVEAGQALAEPGGFVSAYIHAPVAGTVRGLDMVHIGPVNSPCINLKPAEGAAIEAYASDPKPLDLKPLDGKEIIEKIKQAGIVGMGGATFPTHVKLSPPPGVELDTILINGAECEPYLTADDCLMRNHPVQILEGTRAIMQATGVKHAVIGIENNKPEAIASMRKAAEGQAGIEIEPCITRYPQGAEKQLIEALLGRRVAPGQLPFTQGVVVQNVATAAAVYEALATGQPLTRRIITVTGRAVKEPRNVMAPVGTPIELLIEHCGGITGELGELVLGGPMMGRATSDSAEPTIKGTSGILCLAPDEINVVPEDPCIRCGECVQNCPMGLVPTELMSLTANERFEEARGALDCIECGTCAYICPSQRQLVHWIRLAKWELGRMRRREQMKQKEAEAKAASK